MAEEGGHARFFALAVSNAGEGLVRVGGGVPEVESIFSGVEAVGLVETVGIDLGNVLLEVFDVLFDGFGRAGELGFFVFSCLEGFKTLGSPCATFVDPGDEIRVAEIAEDKSAFENGCVIDVRGCGGEDVAGTALDGDGVGMLGPEAGGMVGGEEAEGEEEEGKEKRDSAEEVADPAEHWVIVTGVFGFLLAYGGVKGV